MWQSLISQEAGNKNVNRGQAGGAGYSVGNAIGNIGNRNVPKNQRWYMNLLDFGGGLSQTLGMTNKDSEESYDPYWAYTPEQKAIHQSLGPYLNSKMNGGLNLYGGDYTADLTQGEKDVIAQNARLSALGEQGLGSLLKGEFPEQYYRDTIYQPALKQFKEDIQPLLEEQYAGTGGYWGSARAGAVGKGARDLGDTLAAKRAELAWNVQQNVPNAINAANSLATTGAAIQQTPRLIQQYGLDQQYNEWVRANQESQKYIDQALGFMGLSSGVMDIGDTNIPQTGGLMDAGSLMQLASLFQRNGNSSSNTYSPSTASDFSDYTASDFGSTYQPGLNYNLYSNSYPSTSSGLTNNYNSSALNAMDWRNSGNYQLGNFNY